MLRQPLAAAILVLSAMALPVRAADPAPAHGASAAVTDVERAAAAPDAAHAADGHGEQEGLVEIHLDRAIWTLLIFLILLAILYPTAWKGVLSGLKTREERIRRDLADAEAANARAKATLDQYNKQLADAESRIRDMMSKAQADGERLATTIRMQAQQEAEDAKTRAVKDIDEARKSAVREVYAEAANLATDVAEKILRRNLNADDQRDLVARSLEQLRGETKN